MLMRILVIIGITTLLSGCPIDGDKGNTGLSGINCWDLNENRQADLPAEDTNGDGTVNVKDCRSNAIPAHNPVIVQSGDNLDPQSSSFVLTHSHPRRSFASYKADEAERIILARFGIYVDPIEDTCNLWQWTTDDAGFVFVTANNAYNYKSEHFPKWTTVEDPNNLGTYEKHPGFENCESACLADPDCDGAFYNSVNDTGNSIICKLLTRYDTVQEPSLYFNALGSTPERQFDTATAIAFGLTEIGVISVCD